MSNFLSFIEAFKCGDKIKNGYLDQSCSRMVGTTCNYYCDKFYDPADKKGQAKCESSGWTPTELCKGMHYMKTWRYLRCFLFSKYGLKSIGRSIVILSCHIEGKSRECNADMCGIDIVSCLSLSKHNTNLK
jgi:hypothetical protein